MISDKRDIGQGALYGREGGGAPTVGRQATLGFQKSSQREEALR